MNKKAFLGKSLGKKAFVGDATIIAISMIIIATLGIASYIMFGLDAWGKDVEQIIKDNEYNGGQGEFLLNFLKQDANYENLNNLGLIMLYLYNKIDYEFVNNNFDKILNEKGCWVLQLSDEKEVIVRFRKPDCGLKLNNKLKFNDWGNVVKIYIVNYERKVEISYAVIK